MYESETRRNHRLKTYFTVLDMYIQRLVIQTTTREAGATKSRNSPETRQTCNQYWCKAVLIRPISIIFSCVLIDSLVPAGLNIRSLRDNLLLLITVKFCSCYVPKASMELNILLYKEYLEYDGQDGLCFFAVQQRKKFCKKYLKWALESCFRGILTIFWNLWNMSGCHRQPL